MLFRFVVAMLCLVWSVAEFQCPGPGRFSTSPGFCTNEYYACNREPHKEYIAYVLSCPGHTLFNERTRRCSNAKTVSCTVATNTNHTGLQSPATRSQMQRPTTSPGVFAYRIKVSTKATATRKAQGYTKYGRPSRVTTAPTKTHANQWRIKLLTTKKERTTAWTKLSTSLTRMTNTFKRTTVAAPIRTTHHPIRQMSMMIYYNTTNLLFKNTATVDKFNTIQVTPTTVTKMSLTESLNVSKMITTESTTFQHSPSLTTPGSKHTESDARDENSTNITNLAKISATVSKTTFANKLVSTTTPSSQQGQSCTQITPSHFTTLTKQTTPILSNFHSSLFETTPETLMNDYDKPIPLIDSLEPTEDSNAMKIVYISEDLNYSPGNKKMQQHTKPDGKNYRQNLIQYFYDTDNNTGESPSLKIKENSPKPYHIRSGYIPHQEAHQPIEKLVSRRRQPK